MIRVNGELINPNLIEEAFARIKSEAELRGQVTCGEGCEELEKAAEDEVIDTILIAQEAEKSACSVTEEQIAARLGLLVENYREQGVSQEKLAAEEGSLREEAKAGLRMELFMEERLPRIEDPEEEELVRYYESHCLEYRSPSEVRCLRLMKTINRLLDERVLLEEMTALRLRICEGEDFLEVARQETEKSEEDIELGWISLDRPSNPFESILFSLREGEVSPVISYEHGFHLVQVLECRGGTVPPLEDIRSYLYDRYLFEKKQAAVRVLAGELRGSAQIEYVNFSKDG